MRLVTLILCAILSACMGSGSSEWPPNGESRNPQPGSEWGPQPPEDAPVDDEAAPPEPEVVSCEEWGERAYGVLARHCAACHDAPESSGGMNYVLDADALRANAQVVAFAPEESRLFVRMRLGTMPPAGIPGVGGEDVESVREWIVCGARAFGGAAPPAPPSPPPTPSYAAWEDSILLMRRDIGARRPADQQFTRYLALSAISNGAAGIVGTQREAMSLALNSLSDNRGIVRPREVDARGVIARIDLRDYGMDVDDWELLVADYPYGIRHDLIPANSSRFDAEVVEADAALRRFANTEIAYISSDWFLGNATRAPLYYDLLKVPATLAELEADLGVDIQRNIDDELVDRAGFNGSGVSENNRVIERHDLFDVGGYLWVSYDFINSSAERNVFADPLGFAFDGGEFIWTLPNGLQGYAIADAAGNILDKAPTNVVRHNDRPDGAVEAGISCMGCHHENGVIPKDDYIRIYTEANVAFGELRDDTLALYPTQNDMRAIQSRDSGIFVDARNRASDLRGNAQPVLAMVLEFEDDMTTARVAGALGVPEGELLAFLTADPDAFPPEMGVLRSPGGTLKRDTFDQVFPQAVCALGLGEPICRGVAGDDGIVGTGDDILCGACEIFE